MTLQKIKDDYCLKYGQCNPRNHTCIKGIEGLNEVCLKCKSLLKENEVNKCWYEHWQRSRR